MNQQIYQKCSKKIPSLNLCLSTCFPDSNNFKLDPTSKLFQWPYFSQRPLACILSSSPILAYLEIFFCKFSWPWLFPDIGSDFFPKTTEKCKSRHLRKRFYQEFLQKCIFQAFHRCIFVATFYTVRCNKIHQHHHFFGKAEPLNTVIESMPFSWSFFRIPVFIQRRKKCKIGNLSNKYDNCLCYKY